MGKRRIKRNYRFSKTRLSKVNFDNRCLICSDLDGTLLNKSSQISSYTRDVIKALTEKGHLFCILTARPRRSSMPFYDMLNLNTPIVNYNGARINNPKDKGFEELNFFINTELIFKIFKDKEVNKHIDNVIFETRYGTYLLKSDGDNTAAKVHEKLAKFNIYTTDDVYFVSDDFRKLRSGAWSILVALNDMNEAAIFSEKVRKICSSVTVRSWTEEHVGVIIEINSTFPSKGMALKFLASYYDVPPERCYAFGDNENDVEMLIEAKNGYAMKNGTDYAKQAANNITDYGNDEDGVARQLNKLFKLGVEYKKPEFILEKMEVKAPDGKMPIKQK